MRRQTLEHGIYKHLLIILNKAGSSLKVLVLWQRQILSDDMFWSHFGLVFVAGRHEEHEEESQAFSQWNGNTLFYSNSIYEKKMSLIRSVNMTISEKWGFSQKFDFHLN